MSRRASRRTWWLASAFAVALLAQPSFAADADVVATPAPKGKARVVATDSGAPLRNKSVEFGCKRIWRCDAQVCEWRRGCWGIYGYMESPYYSVPLAQRQWQQHGWPTSSR
jgi:hypothetical protein